MEYKYKEHIEEVEDPNNSPSFNKYKLSSGYEIPVIGIGVYLVSVNTTSELVYQALKIGYRLIDTAQIYRNEHEVSIGVLKWINEDPANNKRKDVFIITKVWNSFHGLKKSSAALKYSVNKICLPGIDYIDLILIHSPTSTKQLRLETYSVLQTVVDSGYCRSIGVSNYSIDHLKELLDWKDLKYPPVVNQLEIHPWLMRIELVNFCSEHSILVQAYSPLTKSRKFNDIQLNQISKKYEKSNAQVLLKWSVQNKLIPVVKTMQLDRLYSNFQLWDWKLSDEDMKALNHPKDYYVTGWDPTLYKDPEKNLIFQGLKNDQK